MAVDKEQFFDKNRTNEPMPRRCLVKDGSEWFNGKVSLDTFDVAFDPEHLASYLDLKESQINSLVSSRNIDPPLDYKLLAFEQVLSHEAFHVYQVLRYSILAELSLAQRSVGLLKFDYFTRSIGEGHQFDIGEGLLDAIPTSYGNHNIAVSMEYEAELQKAESRVFEVDNVSPYSLLEIIEGAAVSFQLLATGDPLAKAVPHLRAIYKCIWEEYCQISRIDKEDIDQVTMLRVIHIFATDIFLKFSYIHFNETREFLNFITVSSSFIDKIPRYRTEFHDATIREEKFVEALTCLSEDREIDHRVLDFCGRLPYPSQEQLYVYVRLYIELFQRLALAGAEGRWRPSNNINRSINKWLEERFPYWDSDLCLPCVLCNYHEGMKFSFIWKELGDVSFIDDTRSQVTSVGAENTILNFVRRFEIYLEENDDDNYCCLQHGLISKHSAVFKSCGNLGSLNGFLEANLNTNLSKVVR